MKLIFFLSVFSIAFNSSLQEAYDNASSNENYDKYVMLEPNSTYTGGLGIYEGDVYINCQGSTIDLEGGNGIWVYADVVYPSSLVMEYCSVTNGPYYGISFGGMSEGYIRNCNFVNTNFGLKLFDVSEVSVTNCIFSNHSTYGLGLYGEDTSLDISFSLFWENEESDSMESCPGWGNIWTPLELTPGNGIIYENPDFININTYDFNLSENSPCINNGNPNYFDSDGSISDIGAKSFVNQNCQINGDLNNDTIVNVLDAIDLVNCVLYNNGCNICYDMNYDSDFNILDILNLINIIIN